MTTRDEYVADMLVTRERAIKEWHDRAERAEALASENAESSAKWLAAHDALKARAERAEVRLAEAERFLADEDRCSKWRIDVSDFLSRSPPERRRVAKELARRVGGHAEGAR